MEQDNTAPKSESPPETAQANETSSQDAEITRLREESAKFKDQWIRAAAEAENIRKRASRDLEETARFAASGFARDMVSVLENLKRASESVPESARAESDMLRKIGEGIDLTLAELLGIFERNGIRRIDPAGQKFDHNFHQAVVQVERDDVPAGTVVQVVQAGYIMHDRLLRPAMVAVSKQPDATKKVDTTA